MPSTDLSTLHVVAPLIFTTIRLIGTTSSLHFIDEELGDLVISQGHTAFVSDLHTK